MIALRVSSCPCKWRADPLGQDQSSAESVDRLGRALCQFRLRDTAASHGSSCTLRRASGRPIGEYTVKPKLASIMAVTVALALASATNASWSKGGGGGRGGGGHGGGGHGGGGHGGGHFGGHGGGHFGGHGGGHYGGHFHGGHFGGFHHFGGARFARHGGPHFGHFSSAALVSHTGRSALNSFSHAGARGRILANPMARAQIAAAAAVTGWHGGFANGWWRHGNGGYGWVGPLFWPFAYYDMYDYAVWGDGFGFWGYGYPDIYAGIFAPYGYGELSGYMMPPSGGRRYRGAVSLARMCSDDSRDIAGLPVDQIGQAIEPTEAQRPALDELADASIKAAQMIRAS